MTKAEMLYEMLPTILQDCPSPLEDCVRQVFHSLKRHEVGVFFNSMELIAITCEDDEWWNDLLFGKVHVKKQQAGTQYLVNIFPATLNESTDDIKYIVCQELAQLYYLLQGVWVNGEMDEISVDDFTSQHGFYPERIHASSCPSRSCASQGFGIS